MGGQDWPCNCFGDTLEGICGPFLVILPRLEVLGGWFEGLVRDSLILG